MADRFRDPVAGARDLIATVDRSGSLTHVGPSVHSLLGVLPADIAGQVLWELVHPDDIASVQESIARLFESGERTSLELALLDASGRWRRLDAALQRADDGRPNEAVLTATEVTKPRDADATLRARDDERRQARKMEVVGRLASGITHDFGNLLTVIIGASGQLLDDLPPGSPERAHVESIHESAERAASMVRQLLGFGRGRSTPQTPVDLNLLVARADLLLRRLLGEHIELRTVRAPGLWPVSADPIEIEQALFNLAVNARDAMPAGGLLTIETRNVTGHASSSDAPVDDMVSFSVSDTGSGMDPETEAHAFDPFFTTKAEGKGTGLGLSTVRAVVTELGGRVAIVTAPGQGTTVTVMLPRAAEAAALPVAPADEARAVVRGRGETLLLVEDEDGVRELVRDMLEIAGYKVLEAATPGAAEAISREREAPLDLLLTDVVMPEMSGLDLSARLRARHPNLRVMYMSGFPEPTIGDGTSAAPGAHFISKPFDRKTLLLSVRRALDAPEAS